MIDVLLKFMEFFIELFDFMTVVLLIVQNILFEFHELMDSL